MEDKIVPVGGDFSRIFDRQDYLAMVSIPDEATCILRGHLILEEVLNLWSSKITSTDDLFSGIFVPFKTKLVICKNMCLDEELFDVLDKINNIRNRFSHRKGYKIELSSIDSLKNKVNSIVPSAKIQDCETFHIFLGGKDQNGNPGEKKYTWEDSDNRLKFVLIFVILMLKITYWMQIEFNNRGIDYTIRSIDHS